MYLKVTALQGGFVLAIDVDFDPDETGEDRAEEPPGFDSTLRISEHRLLDFRAANEALNSLCPSVVAAGAISRVSNLPDCWAII